MAAAIKYDLRFFNKNRCRLLDKTFIFVLFN